VNSSGASTRSIENENGAPRRGEADQFGIVGGILDQEDAQGAFARQLAGHGDSVFHDRSYSLAGARYVRCRTDAGPE
jgi:hypothetical protein